jgi:uncharacterized membrane protein
MSTKKLVRMSVIAALYVVLTLALPAMAYGPIQFRLSEVMTLLAFIDPFYILPLTLGCAIANIGSPFGIIDIIVGSLASFLALYSMSKTKNIYIASLFPTLFCIFIGLEILFLSNEPINLFLVTGQIMISEFIVVSIIGVGLFKIIEKNDYIMNMLKSIPKD